MTSYRVTHLIEVEDGHGLVAFTNATPRVFSQKNGYRVISCSTEPLLPLGHYMQPAIDRARHTREGTEAEERVTYSFPVGCEGWLATLMMRQGYGALPDGDGMRVVTSSEVDEFFLAQVQADVAKAEEKLGEVNGLRPDLHEPDCPGMDADGNWLGECSCATQGAP